MTYGSIAITGASGWVGRCALDLFGGEMSMRLHGFASRERKIITGSGTSLVTPLGALMDERFDSPLLLVDCAFPTQDRVDAMGDREYVYSVEQRRSLIVDVIRRHPCLDVIYISSGAATLVSSGVAVANRTKVYGQAKLDDEAALASAAAASGGRLCIVRAFALSGPYMTKPTTYALGSMILQAQATGMVEVRADRLVRRSYMAIDDMLRIAMDAVGQLDAGELVMFETAGEIVEMADLATRVLAATGHNPGAVHRPTFDAAASPDDYLGDPAVLDRLAAVAAVTPANLDDQVRRTANWLSCEKAV